MEKLGVFSPVLSGVPMPASHSGRLNLTSTWSWVSAEKLFWERGKRNEGIAEKEVVVGETGIKEKWDYIHVNGWLYCKIVLSPGQEDVGIGIYSLLLHGELRDSEGSRSHASLVAIPHHSPSGRHLHIFTSTQHPKVTSSVPSFMLRSICYGHHSSPLCHHHHHHHF